MRNKFKIHSNLYNNQGFTLAEVLITLGIIGVVAAMTIPTLMQNIQDRQFKEAAKSAYSKASQAIMQIKQDNGGDLSSYYTTGNSFKPVFMTYFKVIKDCNLQGCVLGSDSSTIYTSLTGVPANTHCMGNGQFMTADGMFWGIVNGNFANNLWIAVDVNGLSSKPNIYGRDVFFFQLINDSLIPMGSANAFNSTPSSYCNKSVSSNWAGFGCMYYVMQGTDY